jgi:hypothetical protein
MRLSISKIASGLAALAGLAGLASALTMPAACSVAEGDGYARGTLNAPSCWTGRYDLAPDFFAANSYKETLLVRIQNGSDSETFSDGISLVVDDKNAIRSQYGKPLRVTMPIGVAIPGAPVIPDPDPSLVHLSMYLQRTCRTLNVTLHAVSEVAPPSDGTCTAEAIEKADPATGCSGGLPEGVGSLKSTLSFTSISSGPIGSAADRLIEGCFDVYLADPRDRRPAPGASAPDGGEGTTSTGDAGTLAATSGAPPPCRGHIRGKFRFYEERGRPAQPFP